MVGWCLWIFVGCVDVVPELEWVSYDAGGQLDEGKEPGEHRSYGRLGEWGEAGTLPLDRPDTTLVPVDVSDFTLHFTHPMDFNSLTTSLRLVDSAGDEVPLRIRSEGGDDFELRFGALAPNEVHVLSIGADSMSWQQVPMARDAQAVFLLVTEVPPSSYFE